MSSHSPGKIFLADQLGLVETQWAKRYSTFNCEGFYNGHKEPFKNLQAYNEIVLAAAQSTRITCLPGSFMILIPVTGEIKCLVEDKDVTVSPEETVLLAFTSESVISISNPYVNETVSVLQVAIDAGSPLIEPILLMGKFDFGMQKNQLIPIVKQPGFSFSMHIGLFDGRRGALHKNESSGNSVFVSVICGAFEVQGRLLHEKDGLALWETNEVDIEALSNHAIILLIELHDTQAV